MVHFKKSARDCSIAALAFAGLVSCSSISSLSSDAPPGTGIITFPNNLERTGTTLISSSPSTEIAGVNGRALAITELIGSNPVDMVALDINGNLGIRGSLSSVSSRSMKKDIARYSGSALAVLDTATVVTYRYRGEPESAAKHIGFIAEDAPKQMSGLQRNSINLNNSVALNIAATKELLGEVRDLRAVVGCLERNVAALQARRQRRTEMASCTGTATQHRLR